MREKNIFGSHLNNAITSEEILGKEVIDSEGGVLGVVEKVLIDLSSLDFAGISVDKGFVKRGITIGKNYIDRVTDHAVFLKVKIAYEMKGMLVFDKDGKTLGRISSVELIGNRNKIKNIFIKTNFIGSFFKKEIVIPYAYVETIGENVMLNVTKQRLIP